MESKPKGTSRKEDPNQKPSKTTEADNQFTSVRFTLTALVVFWVLVFVASGVLSANTDVLPYSQFLSDLKKGVVQEVVVTDKELSGTIRRDNKEKRFVTYRVDPVISNLLANYNLKFSAPPPDTWGPALTWIFWIGMFLLLSSTMLRRFQGGGDGIAPSMMGIERTHARIVAEDKVGISFADVAGVDEAIEELKEVVTFLKEPTRYSRLGGRLPKGILLVGPPGTGKTLLARAVAGEAGVPFFSISGSEFVELFVGVGAARVRDLFAQARQKAPCIIFIDELDALGRSRGANPLVGGHDEKEQTLNQLLVELDGFDTSTGIVLLSATNRPEILDKALLRAGRFDRHVVVDRPDKQGREAILHVHMKKVSASPQIDILKLASATPGFTGADLANVVNEAALLAARRGADLVEQRDFDNAIERTIAGLEKKNRILSLKERRVVAFHEMGHALVSMNLPGVDSVEKVSIIPRGVAALGYTIQRPEEDRFILSHNELKCKLAALLGGRASEMLVYGDSSTGAFDDLAKATEVARSMVTRYGMDDKLGLVAYETGGGTFIEGNEYLGAGQSALSDATARQIEDAIRALLDEAFGTATTILTNHRDWLEVCAEHLLQAEVLSADEIRALRPERTKDEAHGSHTTIQTSRSESIISG